MTHKSGRGGYRPGAGRPPGSPNVKRTGTVQFKRMLLPNEIPLVDEFIKQLRRNSLKDNE